MTSGELVWSAGSLGRQIVSTYGATSVSEERSRAVDAREVWVRGSIFVGP